jgi:hypothetical protein
MNVKSGNVQAVQAELVMGIGRIAIVVDSILFCNSTEEGRLYE